MAAEQANQELRHQISRRSAQLFTSVSTTDVSGPTPVSIAPGVIIDERYQVLAPLGRGAMGEVFEVERLNDKSRWALKTTYSAHAEVRARLLREAHILSQVRHPNVVQVVDVDAIHGGMVYLVLEFVRGMDLKAWRKSENNQGVEQKLQILLQVMRGLDALHRSGIAHRDLKPQNVLLAETARGIVAKLADFGISRTVASGPMPDENASHAEEVPSSDGTRTVPSEKSSPDEADVLLPQTVESASSTSPESQESQPTAVLDAGAQRPSEPATPLTGEALGTWDRTTADFGVTKTGAIAGTPLYLAPEVLRPGVSFFEADMFAFGVLAYELLCEKHPFGAPVVGHLRSTVRLVGPLSGEVTLDGLVLACLAFDPGQRPTASEALQLLEEVAQSGWATASAAKP